MRGWRLATSLHPPLTGEGAAQRGGRWNSIGVSVVYASTHLSLALVELLVHLDALDLPRNLIAYAIELPDDVLERLDTTMLPVDWRNDLRATRGIGDRWIERERSLALAVPSVVVPQEANILLNPAHVRFSQVQVSSQNPFDVDPRLLPNLAPE